MRLDVHGIATGGDGVARDASGRVVFVAGALPGDTVEVEVVSERKRFAHARLVQVITPSDMRREPACRHVAEGCGGCDFAHVRHDRQGELKAGIVRDVLERIGRIADPPVHLAGTAPEIDYRTTLRAGVRNGSLGLRRAKSHEIVATPDCRVVAPEVRAMLRDLEVQGSEAVLRSGDEGAVAMAVDGVVDATVGDGTGQVPITVAGRTFQVSADSFFQSGPAAAELLVREVDRMVGATPYATDTDATMVDLYGGVGLFAGTVGFAGSVVLVELSPAAVADARVNLAELGERVQVVEDDVRAWPPQPADVVVADPSRQGLEAAGVDAVVATGAGDVVLVSCDAGALGRDAGLLVEAGYILRESAVLDLFPGTSHVEIVSHFTRSAG